MNDQQKHWWEQAKSDHAVFVLDVLIPIRCLVNGRTIRQIPVDRITYYHVELPRHAILSAEGLACESFLDTGNRGGFANTDDVNDLPPDFAAWTWDARRGQYYLHNFLPEQPDLNLHHPEVQEALLATARFWLDRGVDGFRVDAVNFFMCDPELRDNAPAPDLQR